MIFGVLNPEETWHHQLVHLPTSPVYCSHCTLGNPKSRFINIIIFIHILHIIFVISKENKLLPTTPEKCHRSILWNANLFHLTEGNVAFHHALLKFSPCRNKTLPQLVRIADWYSLTHYCSSQTRLYQPHPHWAWSKNQRAVLPRRVADAEAATAICSVAGNVFVFRQCANTSCLWDSRVSAQWTSQFTSPLLTCGQPTLLTSSR